MHKSMPQSLKQTNSGKKSLGVVFLDDATQEEINKGNLSLIITIPPRCMNIHPPPNTRFPKKKGTSHLPMGRHQLQRENRKQHILIAIHTLQQWKKKYCRAATIHETNLIAELTSQPLESLSLQEKDWHGAIQRAWKWTTSPTGSQGIVLKEDQSNVNRLKGSKNTMT
jgi:hypothetical protein